MKLGHLWRRHSAAPQLRLLEQVLNNRLPCEMPMVFIIYAKSKSIVRLGHLWRPPNFCLASKLAGEDSFPPRHRWGSLMTPVCHEF